MVFVTVTELLTSFTKAITDKEWTSPLNMFPIVQSGAVQVPKLGVPLTKESSAGSASLITRLVTGSTPKCSTVMVKVTVSPSKTEALSTVLEITISGSQL